MNAGFSNLATLKKFLLPQSVKDTSFDKLILAIGLGAAAQFENLTQRRFARVVGDTEVFPADRSGFLLSRIPLETVTQAELKLEESSGWSVQTDPNFIRAIDQVDGIIDCGPGDAGPFWAQVRFTYTGGYWWETLDQDEDGYPSQMPTGAAVLPDDLRTAWLLQCKYLWAGADKLGTDTLKDGSAAVAARKDFAPTVEKTVGQYIRFKLI